MIKQTFLFLPGISNKKEFLLKKQGILDWKTFISTPLIKGISQKRKKHYDELIKKAINALQSEETQFFNTHLPKAEHWRLYKYFREDALFVDIEVEHVTKEITLLGMYDGEKTYTFVKNVNFDIKTIKKIFSQAKLLVTFNGNVFDLPFLEKKYGIKSKAPRFDVRVACARVGLIGGLKKIEQEIGLKRNNAIVKSLKQGDPAQLYRMWKNSGDKHFLSLLIEYNEEDIVNLQYLADNVYKKLADQTRKQNN